MSVKMRYFPKEVGFNPIGSSSMTSKVKNGSIKGSFCWFKLEVGKSMPGADREYLSGNRLQCDEG